MTRVALTSLTSAPAAPRRVEVTSLVAPVGFAPHDWQSAAPEAPSGWAVGDSAELRRVAALPRRPRPDDARFDALVEYVTGRYRRVNPSCQCARLGRECVDRLRPAQAWALYELGLAGGILGPIGVGHGKTLLDLLAPLALPSCRTALLLLPASLLDQLITEYNLVGQHFRVPSIVVHGRGYGATVPGAPVLHAMSYERLSTSGSTQFLEDLRPDLIVADECHRLRHPGATRTARVMRFFAAHQETRFCGWSGSMTDSSLKDFAHLSALALRERSPLPIDPIIVADWGRAVDPTEFPSPPGALLRLCDPGEHVRSGVHRRLVETLGVVATADASVDIGIEVHERPAPPIPHAVEEALRGVRATWTRPDGDELVDAMSVARCCRELACGFYYRWTFPRGESRELIESWFRARKEWRCMVRDVLRDRRPHLDSPLLAWRAAERGWAVMSKEDRVVVDGLPCWRASAWPAWRDVKKLVKPETEAVVIDDYLARDAAAWGRETRGVIWYEHTAFGKLVANLSGLPLHDGGTNAGTRIAAEKGDRSIVASIKSHGTGRDGLQRIFKEQLVANPPSSATAWEQMIGRLHRVGQKADMVETYVYRHTSEMEEIVAQALSRAAYVQQTLGSAQKLIKGLKFM